MHTTEITLTEQEEFPRVVFMLQNVKYCVSSTLVNRIAVKTDFCPIPDQAMHFMGVAHLNGGILPVLNMRSLFNMCTLKEELDRFATMKEMHLNWVKTLERCVNEKTDFTLDTDPRKCSFGKWYSHFHTDNATLNFILKQIETPHNRMHAIAQEIYSNPLELAQSKLEEAKTVCRHGIVPLLDRLIEAWRDLNKGILIVLEYDNKQLGIYVDDVLTLVSFEQARLKRQDQEWRNRVTASRFVRDIIVSPNGDILLELDVASIFTLL